MSDINDVNHEETIDAICGRCGQTFAAFLHQMADQNAKVVCPRCAEGGDCAPKSADQIKLVPSLKRIQ